jgi:hypothetical protein
MKSGKIIQGEGFDWQAGRRAQDAIAATADEHGRVDGAAAMGAALMADPGVCHCPVCETYLWAEGEVLECPTCQAWLKPQGSVLVTTARRELPRYGLAAELAEDPVEARELLGQRARGVLATDGPCGGNEVELSGAACQLAVLWMIVEGSPDELIEVCP